MRRTCFALATLGALALGACDRHPADPPPVARPVLSVVVQPTSARDVRTFTGNVQPRYEAQLGFQVAGRMVARNVNVGDSVTKGQELAALDPTVARLSLVSAQADVTNAQAQLANASATFLRQQELVKTESSTQAQLDAAVAARETAQARLNQALANLQKAQEQLGYTTLASDHDGVVTTWNAEVGQIVAASQPVVAVARPDVRDAVFDVPDDRIAAFPAGATFDVSLLADDSVKAPGKVREIAPQSDPATRTRRIRLTLQSPPDAFRLGTTVRIGLAGTAQARLELPATAILERDGKSFVWRVQDDGKVQALPVTLGDRGGARVTIAEGLAGGERIVIAGVHSLSDGQVVKVQDQ